MQLFVLTLNPCIFLINAPQTLYGHLSLCYNLTVVINTLICLFHPESRILFQPGPCMQTGMDPPACPTPASGIMHSHRLSMILDAETKSTISVAAPTVLWMIVRPSV